jgi:iron only hydrogenase large subunit-like protein
MQAGAAAEVAEAAGDDCMELDSRGVSAGWEASTSALTGSGGYLEHLFRSVAWELHGVRVTGPLVYTTIRNTDFKETVLEVDGRVVLRFAAVYGFRNIQNLLRKIKLGRSEYDYVEIMACPSGCLNGGGQLKPDAATGQTAKQLLEEVGVAQC